MSYKIGIIGGGQLGMMMVDEAHKLGLKTIVLDPNPKCSASFNSDEFIEASYDDIESLNILGKSSDVITYEFENIKSEYLHELNERYNLKQGITPLFDSQDRLREKTNANRHGLKTAKFFPCDNESDLKKIKQELNYPFIYKTRTMGYDGHGQVVIKSDADLLKLNEYFQSHILGIVEEFIPFDYECSIIMVRSKDKIIHFPIGRNIHKDGILDITINPYQIDKNLENEIIKQSEKFMISAGYEGILAIEYFIKGNDFYFNEMAPRPHNSGHYTIEGTNTNQFKELIKYLADIPLTDPKVVHPTIMKNILGRDLKYVDSLKKIKGANLHMYNKDEARPLRKMGHITFIDMTLDEFNLEFEKIKKEEN